MGGGEIAAIVTAGSGLFLGTWAQLSKRKIKTRIDDQAEDVERQEQYFTGYDFLLGMFERRLDDAFERLDECEDVKGSLALRLKQAEQREDAIERKLKRQSARPTH